MCEGLFNGWIWAFLVDVMHTAWIFGEGKGIRRVLYQLDYFLTFVSIYSAALA